MNQQAKAQITIEKLIKVLGEQRRALVAAQSDEELLRQYGALIRFLRGVASQELERIFGEHRSPLKSETSEQLELSEAEIANMPGNDVEKIINDEATPRKLLEQIAIHRFQVPRGSIRRFSNRGMLIQKLVNLLRNEQAHSAIEAVARGQAAVTGNRS